MSDHRKMFKYREKVTDQVTKAAEAHKAEGDAIEHKEPVKAAEEHKVEGEHIKAAEDSKPLGKGNRFNFAGRFKHTPEGKAKAEAKEKEHPGSFIQEKTDKKLKTYYYVMKAK